jgi:hypothetical protein
MSLDVKILLERMKTKIVQELSEHVSLLITTKHLNSTNDVDLFIILDNPPIDDPYNVKAYIKLVNVVKRVEKEMVEENNIRIIDFSTIRIKEYHCRKERLKRDQEVLLLHLLIYPTLDHFLAWENSSIILSICTHHRLLYGDEEILENLRNRIKAGPFEERIQPLVSLLFETYRNMIFYVEVPEDLEEILINEGFKKLEYVLRFLIWELLMENNQTIPPPEINTVLWLAKNNNINGGLVEMLEKIETIEKQELSLPKLKLLYEECMREITESINRFREGEKDDCAG